MARFDWETTGSGLTHWDMTPDRAAEFLDNSFGRIGNAFNPLGVAGGGGMLPGAALLEAERQGLIQIGRQDPGFVGLDSAGLRSLFSSAGNENQAIIDSRQFTDEAIELFGDVDFAGMSPAQKANVVDSVIRAREEKNQRPKRRLEVAGMSIHPGMLVGGAFGAQFLGGLAANGHLSNLGGNITDFIRDRIPNPFNTGTQDPQGGFQMPNLGGVDLTDWQNSQNPDGGQITEGPINDPFIPPIVFPGITFPVWT